MTRGRKIAAIVLGGIAGLVLLTVVGVIVVVQTDWFRNTVREKLIGSVETATGGRTEVGSFNFDWQRLRVEIRNFVIHGNEPAGSPPLFSARLLQADLRLLTPFKRIVDIASVVVDTPQANVIVYPDGSTNIPSPKTKKQSDKTALETIVDLAIGRFQLSNGSLVFGERRIPLNAEGRNLRAQFTYNETAARYRGDISMAPLRVRSAANAPVDIDVAVPLVLERDRIQVNNGRIVTPQSLIRITGAMDQLRNPRANARVSAKISLQEAKRVGGLEIPLDTSGKLPDDVNADAAVYVDENRIRVDHAHVALGLSTLDASGVLKDVASPAGLRFNGSLALGEIGRMLRVAARPEGVARVNGEAAMTGSEWRVRGNVDARNLAFTQGGRRFSDVRLISAVAADPNRIDLTGLRLDALGGAFTGSASLVNRTLFNVSGRLQDFGINEVAAAFTREPLPHSGVVSGPVEARGSIREPADAVARANLAIAPGKGGVPVSGRINAAYNGRAETVDLGRSFVALPNSRIDLSGSLGRQIQVRLVSRNLAELAPGRTLPVALKGGAATFDGTVSGRLDSPRIAGRLRMTEFVVEDRPFDLLAADIQASETGAALRDGTLARGALQARFSASVGLRGFKPEPSQPLTANLEIRNADARDILVLAGQGDIPARGDLTAFARITGTIGDPRGELSVNVANGSAYQQPIDRLEVRAVMTERAITVPTLALVSGPARVSATASYTHPPDDLKRGDVAVHLSSNNVLLGKLQALVKDRPGLAGTANIFADLTGTVQPVGGKPQFQIATLNGNAAVRGLELQGKKLGDLNASAQTLGGAINYGLQSDFAGSNIRVTGRTMLAGNYATSATAAISNLPIEPLLALAGRRDIEATGTISANGKVWGTTSDPRASATVGLTDATIRKQPLQRAQATFTYTNQFIELPALAVETGDARLDASGSFRHPAGDYQTGDVRFRVATNRFRLDRLRAVQTLKSGLAGTVELKADGAATLRRGTTPLISSLNANLDATGVVIDNQPGGSFHAAAETRGTEVVFNLKSDFARADIRGNGRMTLRGDYPLNAELTFANLTYEGLRPWIGGTARQNLNAIAEGRVTVNGPAERPENLGGTLEIARLEVNSTVNGPGGQQRRNVQLRNAGPVTVALERSVLHVRSAHITGPYTDLTFTGTAGLRAPRPLDVRANGNIRLEVLEAFSENIFSSGTIALNTAVQGTVQNPAINGRIDLRNASFNMIDMPNGITNANGALLFNGQQAIIENVTGETGGGKITLAGVIGYGAPEMRFRVNATARDVRIQYPPNVNTEVNANLALNGVTSRSVLSGDVTIEDVAFYSRTDVGSILSQGARPPSAPAARTGILGGMRLDVRIETAPDLQVRTTLAQNIQAEAQLRVRGSPNRPGMLGRVNVIQGEAVFFGSRYTIDQGTVNFYDPQRIDPIINLNLSTRVRAVDVTLTVSGPMDRLKLTYRSDPPLQFSEVISLLATGKPPTSDPVLAARAPAEPQQSFQQMGASTLLGQAVANPVAGRLQRLFGVSKIKIDPQIIGAENTPQARFTIEQQVTRDIVFTYIQDVTSSNPQLIRVEWAFDPTWSAILQRQENGQAGLDLYYKRRFR